MNRIPRYKQEQIIAALVEGCSIRNVDYAMLVKTFVGDGHPSQEGYSPAQRVLRCDPLLHNGYIDPWLISTAHIERQNATLRHFAKRLARLTYAFSKKLENLRAALDLHFCWYNFGRLHRTLRMTPAMAAGVATRFWSVEDLLPEWSGQIRTPPTSRRSSERAAATASSSIQSRPARLLYIPNLRT